MSAPVSTFEFGGTYISQRVNKVDIADVTKAQHIECSDISGVNFTPEKIYPALNGILLTCRGVYPDRMEKYLKRYAALGLLSSAAETLPDVIIPEVLNITDNIGILVELASGVSFQPSTPEQCLQVMNISTVSKYQSLLNYWKLVREVNNGNASVGRLPSTVGDHKNASIFFDQLTNKTWVVDPGFLENSYLVNNVRSAGTDLAQYKFGIGSDNESGARAQIDYFLSHFFYAGFGSLGAKFESISDSLLPPSIKAICEGVEKHRINTPSEMIAALERIDPDEILAVEERKGQLLTQLHMRTLGNVQKAPVKVSELPVNTKERQLEPKVDKTLQLAERVFKIQDGVVRVDRSARMEYLAAVERRQKIDVQRYGYILGSNQSQFKSMLEGIRSANNLSEVRIASGTTFGEINPWAFMLACMRYDLLWHESGLDRVDVIPYFVLDEDKVTDGIVPLVMEPQNAIELFNALKDVWVRLHQ